MAFSLALTATVLWFLFMTYLSHQDGEHTRKTSRELADRLTFLQKDRDLLNGRLRSAAHVVTYMILAVLLGITLALGGAPLGALGGVLVWAWLDEATKHWIPGRHFSWWDVGLNCIGTGLGCIALWLLL